MKNRRDFIKTGCILCLSASPLGILLQSCASTQQLKNASLKDKTLIIPKTNLQTQNALVVSNNKLPFRILVVKEGQNFKALQMRCTHNDVGLSYTGKKLVCNAHGSEFDLNGQVVKEPAQQNLTIYNVTQTEQNIIIHL